MVYGILIMHKCTLLTVPPIQLMVVANEGDLRVVQQDLTELPPGCDLLAVVVFDHQIHVLSDQVLK